jgi:hypothetical protein
MTATILTSVFANGGRTSRYGDYTVVFMHAAAFITPSMTFMQAQNWARGRMSSGNPVRDRTAFVDHLETVIARVGSGFATKGPKKILAALALSMKANAMFMEEWSIPRDLDTGVEVKKMVPRPMAVVAKVPEAVIPAANETPAVAAVEPEETPKA